MNAFPEEISVVPTGLAPLFFGNPALKCRATFMASLTGLLKAQPFAEVSFMAFRMGLLNAWETFAEIAFTARFPIS